MTLFGTDYPTLDGTCLRDYIHMDDLCQAHLLALERLTEVEGAAAYNLGNSEGFSVRQVIDAVERISRKRIQVSAGLRRAGDAAVLTADPRKALAELGWRPRYQSLDTIIGHAWEWEMTHNRSKQDSCGGLE